MREERDASVTGGVGVHSEGTIQPNDPDFKPFNSRMLVRRDVSGSGWDYELGEWRENRTKTLFSRCGCGRDEQCEERLRAVFCCPIMTKLRTPLLPSDVNSMRQ